MSLLNFRYLFPILTLFVSGCTRNNVQIPPPAWMNDFIEQETKKVITIQKYYDYGWLGYKFESMGQSFRTFDKDGRNISFNHNHFYKYDTKGKIIEEQFCMRTCEKPAIIKYSYDNDKLLKKEIYYPNDSLPRLLEINSYDNKGLLIKKIFGDDTLSKSEIYSYDSKSNIKSKYIREYNTNTNSWIEYLDSFYYDYKNNLIRQDERQIGLNYVTTYTMVYNKQNLLVSKTYKTKSPLKSYQFPKEEDVSFSSLFGGWGYKYDSEKRLIEEIIFRPDAKTPSYKFTYEYK